MITSAHFYRLVPVVFSVAALILVVLALAAGNKPGVLDAYDIITVNTSALGKVKGPSDSAAAITLKSSRTTAGDCDGVGNLLGPLCNSMVSEAPGANTPATPSPAIPSPTTPTSPKSSNKPKDRNDGSDTVDPPTQNTPVRDFYSLYALTVCEGDYTPDGGRNLIECHPYFSDNEPSTIPYLLAVAISRGDPGHNVSLSDLGLTYPLESALDGLPPLFKAIAVIFSIGIAFTGLSFIASIPAVSVASDDDGMGYAWSVWANLVFVSSALFFLILGGLIAAIGAKVAEGRVNELGSGVGVTAVAGTNWVALSWAGIALMVVVLAYWSGRASWLRKAQQEGDEDEEEKEEAPPPSRGLPMPQNPMTRSATLPPNLARRPPTSPPSPAPSRRS